MLYLQVFQETAQPLVQAMYALGQGPVGPNLNSEILEVISHPTNETLACVVFPDHGTNNLAIHPFPDVAPFLSLLAILVQRGSITQDEMDALGQSVTGHRGHMVGPANFIPTSWRPFLLTLEQARDAGFGV